ncbi:CIA30 family protein [uncultured Draconibacterium sp.]|uniref:CIA30 family protein n=1 Tax=uncultured Draconibacterium sp. TaxID=1573823 RepID=UPI0025F3FF61|nr:CIA30 family protein [uncultured Draconibacterium sp.]
MATIIGLLLFSALNQTMLFNFSETSDATGWQVVNDDVMGGKSEASFFLTDAGSAVFQGRVSLENYGGFSSLRYNLNSVNTQGYSKVVVHLKGDGKKYQLRIREKESDYFSYISTFQTTGDWEKIEVPLNTMFPSFRGRKLALPNYSGDSMVEITFLIANKKAESFRLELKKAWLD